MDARHSQWNRNQQILRDVLKKPDTHAFAISLFLEQHTMVHEGSASGTTQVTFADEVWQGLTAEELRGIPRKMEHSIAWLSWHMARIEDVTMNVLVAGSEEVFELGVWASKLRVDNRETGNLMPREGVEALSQQIDLDGLGEYRLAVGRRTREIASQLHQKDIHRKVARERIERIRSSGTVIEAASDLLDYWGGLTIAGLLLMPPTRHCLVHWNEAAKVKSLMQKENIQADHNLEK